MLLILFGWKRQCQPAKTQIPQNGRPIRPNNGNKRQKDSQAPAENLWPPSGQFLLPMASAISLNLQSNARHHQPTSRRHWTKWTPIDSSSPGSLFQIVGPFFTIIKSFLSITRLPPNSYHIFIDICQIWFTKATKTFQQDWKQAPGSSLFDFHNCRAGFIKLKEEKTTAFYWSLQTRALTRPSKPSFLDWIALNFSVSIEGKTSGCLDHHLQLENVHFFPNSFPIENCGKSKKA